MRVLGLGWRGLAVCLGMLAGGTAAVAQPAIDAFHWVDFHDSKDAPTVTWVTQTLKAEKWTSIREIGVQWDSAIVLTAERKTPQSTPPTDVYTIWSVSLAKHDVQPLLHGMNPRILNWTTFGGMYQQAPELALLYDDCYGCESPSTFFTTLYYSVKEHAWRTRWMRGDQAATVWTAGNVEGVKRSQAYALIVDGTGRNTLGTWTHNDYGGAKPVEDFVFEYGVDPTSGMEQTQGLSGKHAEDMMRRICRAEPALADPTLAELARGQNSALCQDVPETPTKTKPGRRPTTTPPANNHGQSSPPKALGSKK